ncbi:hypothetical protein NDU88_000767 [Pleurodeles waltl]|uniref:Uncharacterized protein n=1 Tax=Pleurodeles waltl TaxID=8319 RepID=A0AAV7P1R9_PLEWA|nr:hypothetical protein NDU88_000767 [Pleurodeles waltl]
MPAAPCFGAATQMGLAANSVPASIPRTTFQRRLLCGACRNQGQAVGRPPAGRQTSRIVCFFSAVCRGPGLVHRDRGGVTTVCGRPTTRRQLLGRA